jgi:glycosyltransferase involved in cell wall biosynthesis
MDNIPELDIIIPVFNEGENITRVLDALHAAVTKHSYRVLICYDFAEDTTLQALDNYDNPGVNVMRVLNPSRGPHAAVLAGFAASTAPAVFVFPADDDYNPPIIDSMVDMMQGGCDIVCASRFMKGGKMVDCPWLKALFVRSSAWTLHYLARIPTHDSSNGLRMFSRRIIETIPIESTEGFTYSIELLVKTHRLGWRICERPAEWYERGEGEGQSNFKVLQWLPAYLKWFFYAFATTYLFKSAKTVSLNGQSN